MLQATQLSCQRGERLLFSDLSFAVAPGELLQIGGANGSGKTSLLKLLCGLSPPTAGEIRWQGVPACGIPFHSQLFYLGHRAAIKDDFNALENLSIASALAAESLAEDAALDILGRMGLAGLEYLPTRLLSQGQKRRVALARLLLTKAPLWILDEPLTALDINAVTLIQTRLAEHLAQQGTVILTTHQTLQVPGVAMRRIDLN